MKISFDPVKRERALRERGLDFMDTPEVFSGPNYRFVDDRFDYGETRFVVFGLFRGRVVAVVYTEDGHVMRVISARKATKNEEREYFDQVRH